MSDDLTPDIIAASIAAKSDQLNADDLLGGPITVRVTAAKTGSAEQPVNIGLSDRKVPWRPCKTDRRVLVAMWGPNAKDWIGRWLTLARDADVVFGGEKVGGVRVTHMSHINGRQTVMLTASKGKKKSRTIEPLTPPSESKPTRAPVEAPAWAAEGAAALTGVQFAEVEQLLASRRVTVDQVEQALGPSDSWTTETVRAIVGRLNGGAR